jgi:hypothetical protein
VPGTGHPPLGTGPHGITGPWVILHAPRPPRPRPSQLFEAWVASPAFAHGHRGVSGQGENRPPVATHSELWCYEVEVAVPGRPGWQRCCAIPDGLALAAGAREPAFSLGPCGVLGSAYLGISSRSRWRFSQRRFGAQPDFCVPNHTEMTQNTPICTRRKDHS